MCNKAHHLRENKLEKYNPIKVIQVEDMATEEKQTKATAKSEDAEENDDGYYRSCSSSPNDEPDSDSWQTTSSSGIDSTDDESGSLTDSDEGTQPPPINVRTIDDPKFNPGKMIFIFPEQAK